MRTWGGDQVDEAVAGCLAALRPVVDRDWAAVKAGRLEWSCHTTAFHIAEDLFAYAGQLAGRAQEDYVPVELILDGDPDNSGLLQVIETMGVLLATTVRATPPGVRAFHPYPFRSADREGFAAMGIAEVLLHTHDIAEGLGLAYEPPAELCEGVLTRLFPHVKPGPAPWPTLLWATGRGDLPDRAPVTEWRWRNNLVIDAERLTLTGVRPAAARDLSLGGDGGFAWAEDGPYEGTRDAAGMLVQAYEAGVHRPEFGVFALVRHEDGRAIGGMGFHSAPDEEGRVEIGYDLVPSARGQGYATEALRALSRWALQRDDVRVVFATVERENKASRSVVTRAGFTQVSDDGTHLAYVLRRGSA
ncbi:GNAT family N-acetyltransferase [Streptomyces sp. Ru71]|uniref:GNAT family N-acetyltransferase n=1 Tax=Streptomyces sp. Ru71 TaxID=2080746 RepID=UPI000CDDB62E|nr:GNAT family N-acetyltransferase [Streptomyces sp. Ru71]POX50302.1 GNAT family N-acetyltransferase [Streptomyces sp. Ru71]